MKLLKSIGFAAAVMFAPAMVATTAQAAPPVEAFVGYDTFRLAEISPDGKLIAGVRREQVGDVLVVLNWETKKVTPIQYARADQMMEINFVEFKGNGQLIFGVRQKVKIEAGNASINRNESIDHAFGWVGRAYASNVDGSNLVNLYNPSSSGSVSRTASTALISTLVNDDAHVLIAAPRPGGAELRKVNIKDGSFDVIDRGSLFTVGWVLDKDNVPVMREDVRGLGRGTAWLRRAPGTKDWIEVARFMGLERANSGPAFEALGPALESGQVFVNARRDGKDTSGLYVFDTRTGEYKEEVHSDPNFDIGASVLDRKNNRVLAACYLAQKLTCVPKEETFGRHWRAVTRALGEDRNVNLAGRGQQGSKWLLSTNGPKDLGSYYLYDTTTRQLEYVSGQRPEVEESQLPSQHIVNYKASDGKDLWGYLWLPPGVSMADAKNLPIVTVPHGGPEGRDNWGFDPFATWLSANGYAAFQPNFRGGGGQGRSFAQAGWGQWGLRMQEDVTDGVKHLFAQGIADPKRSCVMGWSYGGYVAFTASFQNADVFKCSVAGAGVSDLMAMQRWTRDGEANDPDVVDGGGAGRNSVSYKYWTAAIGDMDRERERLNRHSAAQNANKVGMPLLMIHGDQDEIVPINQSLLMESAMKRAGKDHRLIVLKDTNHNYTMDQGDAWRTVLVESLAFIKSHIGPGVSATPSN